MERTAEYKEGTRKIWKEHSDKSKALKGRRRQRTDILQFGMQPNTRGYVGNVALSATARRDFASVVSRFVSGDGGSGRKPIRPTR